MVGGFLPFLLTIFTDLSATAELVGGATGIAKAVNDANVARKLKPYKDGLEFQVDSEFLTKAQKLKKTRNKINYNKNKIIIIIMLNILLVLVTFDLL